MRASALNALGCAVGIPFADVVADPEDVYRWPKAQLRYKRMPSFKSAFAHPAFEHQVAEAFATWDEASWRPHGAAGLYWSSASSTTVFYDFRTVLLHEIGHTLGLAHPDEAAPVGRNFALDAAGTPASAAANANWVMSTIDTTGFDANKYNQLLSWDDLDALRFSHPGIDLDFRSTNATWLADIELHAADFTLDADLDDECGDEVNEFMLAYAFITDSQPVDVADPTKGRLIEKARIWFNTNTSALGASIGIRTRQALWDVALAPPAPGTPTPQPIRAVQVQTRRANAARPMAHYDNPLLPPGSPQPFRWFQTQASDPAVRDRLLHTWTDSAGGGIAWDEPIRVGLKQDVDNWSAEFLRVVHGAFSATEVPVPSPPLAPIDVQETVVLGAIPLAREGRLGSRGGAGAMGTLQQGEPSAVGFALTNPAYPEQPLRVRRLALADATAGGTVDAAALELEDLTPEMLAERFVLYDVPVGAIDGLADLDAGEVFRVFVAGDPTRLPPETANHAFLADHLDADVVASLQDRPLIVVAAGRSDRADITTTTVLFVSPIVPTGRVEDPRLFLPLAFVDVELAAEPMPTPTSTPVVP